MAPTATPNSFPELEFFQEDFEVQNWWACAHTLHRWTVLVVRFPRRGEPVEFAEGAVTEEVSGDLCIAGKLMLVNDLVKVNMGGKTQVVCQLRTESERLAALRTYFNIHLVEEEVNAIHGWDMELT